jgi:N-acetylneuraminate lyase
MTDFQGIPPAVVTPLDEQGRFLPAAFERLLESLYSTGIDGIYVCGQTGEGLLLETDQRKEIAGVAVRCSPPGKQVIVHVGAHRLADAILLARHASTIGAHAVSSLPPAGGWAYPEIHAYYEGLCAAAELPVFLYFFPEICPAIATTAQLLELRALPNVVGLKFTDFDLFKLSILHDEGAIVFNGRDEVLVAGLLMGAAGGIGSFYNLVPEWFLEVYAHARAGRWEDGTVRRAGADGHQ